MKYKNISYENGLEYLHIPSKSDMVSIGFVVKAGSRDETEKNNGISHFLEHMLFKGTKKRNTNKLLSELDKLGTSYNAMTTYDYTAYELHGNKNDFMKLLDIFIDLYLGANLYQKDIEKERGVILEEYNMVSNDMDDFMLDTLMYEIFEGSTLSLPIIGSAKNIKKFSRNDLVKYRNKFYCPSNTIFITIGDINQKKVSDYIYKKIKKTCYDEILRMHVIPQQEFSRLNITNTESTGQVHLQMGFHHNGYLHDEEYNLCSKILSTSLTSGSSSKLFDILRTKCGLAYNCSSYNMELEDTSIFVIKSAVDEKRCDLAIEKILETLYKVVKKGLTNEEIKRCKKALINKEKLNESQLDQMYHYLDLAIKKQDIYSPQQEQMIIEKFSNKEINNCTKHIFRKNNLNLVLVGKMSKKSKDRIEDLLDKWYYMLN
jgi:predicted Zn-dependent peptidase